MHFALIIHETPDQMARRNGPDAEAYWAAWTAYSKAVADAGVMTGGAGLQTPDTATTLTLGAGGHTVQDGPYADSKEMLGGFFVLDLPSLDEAIRWASRIPSPGGKIEIRPVLPPPDKG